MGSRWCFLVLVPLQRALGGCGGCVGGCGLEGAVRDDSLGEFLLRLLETGAGATVVGMNLGKNRTNDQKIQTKQPQVFTQKW